MSNTIIARFQPKPGEEQQVESILREMVVQTRREPGCQEQVQWHSAVSDSRNALASRGRMNMKKSLALLLAAFGLCVAGIAVAHHSFAAFDMQKTVAISGTVKDFVWANPHSWIYVTVTKADGSSEEWALECSSPNMMIRWGWNKKDIKAGDKITIDIHPSRDGRHVASVYAVFLADGRVLADPMGRRVTGDDLAKGPPSLPEKPTGTPYL